jgi:hypothetical protein
MSPKLLFSGVLCFCPRSLGFSMSPRTIFFMSDFHMFWAAV